MPESAHTPAIAVLIPCYNEAISVTRVIQEYAQTLPEASIYVYDNNSTDDTIALARAAGATVRTQPLQGKGHVIRRMFADIDADVYVLIDGDATYDATAAPAMIAQLCTEKLDMIVGKRLTSEEAAYRPGHRLGNWLLTYLAGRIFGNTFSDMLSGYRVMSRRFVKSFPAHASGFEVETELTVHALEQHMPAAEYPTIYRSRLEGSHSKLSTWKDGLRIMLAILRLTKQGKPFLFFSVQAIALIVAALGLGTPLLVTWLHTGLVPRFPTAILCSSLMVIAFTLLICGLLLDAVTLARREQRHLAYLRWSAWQEKSISQ